VAGAKDQDPQHPAGPERDLQPTPVADLEHQSVKSLSAYYNVSERHLARLCNEFLGVKAEEFIGYRKYLASLAGLHDPSVSLTELAYASGFYDQSHFIREFKAFTGLTPKQYRQQMSDLPGHLFSTQNASDNPISAPLSARPLSRQMPVRASFARRAPARFPFTKPTEP
jgi:AraC-like DNA-binding protein